MPQKNINNRVLVSWSGGKDCCFALYRAIQLGLKPVCLYTSMPGGEHRTFGHGLGNDILEKQAEALQLPIDIEVVNTIDYRPFFLGILRKHKEINNIIGMVFGDLYLMEHRTWLEDVCKEAEITPYFPLWMKPGDAFQALSDFIDLGFETIILKIRNNIGCDKWLGKVITKEFALKNKNLCPMGENGEFHTFVINGPIFKFPVNIEIIDKVKNDKETGLIIKLLN